MTRPWAAGRARGGAGLVPVLVQVLLLVLSVGGTGAQFGTPVCAQLPPNARPQRGVAGWATFALTHG